MTARFLAKVLLLIYLRHAGCFMKCSSYYVICLVPTLTDFQLGNTFNGFTKLW